MVNGRMNMDRPPIQKQPFSAIRRAKQPRSRRDNLFKTSKYNSISPIRHEDMASNFFGSERQIFSSTSSARKYTKEKEEQQVIKEKESDSQR
jgi:hypothetical protein